MSKIENSKIRIIFEQIRKIIPETYDGAHEWLLGLEEAAANNSPGWVYTLRGFVRGLWGAEAIDLADLDDIDKVLEKNGLL